MKKTALLLLALCLGPAAEARVFDISKESFAAYFLMSGGTSALGTTAVKDEGALGLKYSGEMNYNYSGEFGFLYSRQRLGLRFGIEIFKPTALESNVTSNSNPVYTAESSLMGYAPKLALEFNLHGNPVSRSYVSLAGGLANITMKNDYVFASGQSTFPGMADHSIEAKGSSTLLAASLGYENILTDTTTISVEFGYRQMKVNNLQYTKDVSTFGGAKSSGDKVTNADGSARSLDFSGGFISLGFRFYL